MMVADLGTVVAERLEGGGSDMMMVGEDKD